MQLCLYTFLPFFLITPSKLQETLNVVQMAICKTNQDYDVVTERLNLYYDMKLVTFGIDRDRNLIIQFPVFIQPYIQ